MLTLLDSDLAKRAQAGDAEAFGELVKRYQAAVYNTCYRLLGERQAAEDLAQEAFIRAYQRLKTFDAARPFEPWMRRVAANLCVNFLKTQHGVEWALEDDLFASSATGPTDPETACERVERAEAVRAALLALPAQYRVVIVLRHFEEMSYREMTNHLKIPLSDVKSYLFRARRMLAERLKV
jgi:RNA polymerase sigma-70 factor (ECF subfamily)